MAEGTLQGRIPLYTLSRPAKEQRERAAVKTGIDATTSAAKLRQRKLRNKVLRLRREFPRLANGPRHLLLRYCEVDTLAAAVWVALQGQGPVNDAGEPRRLLS